MVDLGIVMGGLGLVTGIASIGYARGQSLAARRQADEAERKRREDATLHVVQGFQSAEFADLVILLETRLPELRTMADWQAMDPDVQTAAARFIQRIEMVAIMVSERIVDLDLVEKSLGGFVTLVWQRIEPAIRDLRQGSDDPFTAEYFEWLADRLAQRSQTQRRPAYEALAAWQA